MSQRAVVVALSLTALACIALYWPGLSGGFILDDFENLRAIQRWLEGGTTYFHAITATESGALRRPVSFATFAAQAGVAGNLHATPLKAGNLAIHVLLGVVMCALAAAALRRDARTARIASAAAVAIAIVWLLAPIQVSTVLYIIQRMAQLSALFTALGLLSYIVMRRRFATDGGGARDWLLTMVVLLAFTAIAALSKENGLLLPYLALVAEYTLFARDDATRRPRAIDGIAIAALAAPLVVIAFAWPKVAATLAAGYTERDFTLAQRVLTEPRVLWDYMRGFAIPSGRGLGLAHDDYPLSTGWFTPWTTVPAIVAWLGLAALAIAKRRRWPAFAFGVGVFFVGHAMESTVLSLEVYFEHRNYFPAIGLLIAAAALLQYARESLAARGAVSRLPLVPIALAGWALLAGFVTYTQARSWSDDATLLRDSLRGHPTSLRLNSLLLAHEIESKQHDDAVARLATMRTFVSPRTLPALDLWRLTADCEAGVPSDPASVAAILDRVDLPITLDVMRAYELVVDRVMKGRCQGIDTDRLIAAMQAQLAAVDAQAHRMPVWRTRYNLSRLLLFRERLPEAAQVADRAWRDSGFEPGPAVHAFKLHATLGDLAACERILATLRPLTGRGDHDLDDVVGQFEAAVSTQRAATPPAS